MTQKFGKLFPIPKAVQSANCRTDVVKNLCVKPHRMYKLNTKTADYTEAFLT